MITPKTPSLKFEDFAAFLPEEFSEDDTAFVKKAFLFSAEVHREQTRDDGSPYFEHPVRVALYLIRDQGVKDRDIISGALLHDTVEDGKNVNLRLIKELFTERVMEWICYLSKPEKEPGLSRERRNGIYEKRLEKAPKEAVLIKIADRLDNVRSLSQCPSAEKVKRYIRETRSFYLPLAFRYLKDAALEMEVILNEAEKMYD